MKKELGAAALLLLLFAGVLINIRVNESIVTSLIAEVDASYESLRSGDIRSACRRLDAATERWLALDGYTHIFIRHSEINSTTDAFYQLRSDIFGGADAAAGSYGLLREALLSLMTMERISPGSVF